MIKVKGIYDGVKIVLLESVAILPNTPVEVLIPEQEQLYWQQLKELGLIKEVRTQPTDELPINPIPIIGVPVSQTIIEERR
jgi:hypothetical protein